MRVLKKNKPDISVYDYSDHRKYLSDYFAAKKLLSSTYSHRLFAQQAGLSSPSHLLMIINGSRNLSIKTIEKFADGLRLLPKEKRYFEWMVLFNQAEDLPSKSKYFQEIMALKISTKTLHKLEREKFEFLSQWHCVAIYVMVGLPNFDAEPAVIAQRLARKITSQQAKHALESLITLGLVDMSAQGQHRQISGAITVADDSKSIAVFDYHNSMIQLASQALRQNSQDLREMNGATVSIAKSRLPELKEKIRAFRKEIHRLASSHENPDEIYQLNIQFFPLTLTEQK